MGFMKSLSVAILFTHLIGPVASANDVLVFSKDSNGKIVQTLVSKQTIKKNMVKTLLAVNDSVLSSISDQEFRAGSWQLKMFSVGFGLSGKIGIGPWDFGSNIKQRVFFAR